ncbi:max-interacting protein 1-like [Clytia hemisphaerica]|uniref:BHLH domain-containing protein n=1 Tax=Clytia hemisphaerica TaxID=252671 RepID=A0A7M5XLF5_9CNID
MTSLNVLLEAAKAVDIDSPSIKRKRNSSSRSKRDILERTPGGGNRQTHNILEKNRRAELKTFFQKLKETVPILQNRPKASNVSVLTESMKYIQELNEIDKQHSLEITRLRRCRMCLEERIKMLKEEIDKLPPESRPKIIFKETPIEPERESTDHANPSPTTSTGAPPKKPKKEMVSIEIQANEEDIRDALPESYADEKTFDQPLPDVLPAHETLKCQLHTEPSSEERLTNLKDKLMRKRVLESMLDGDEDSENDEDVLKIVCEELKI